MFWVFSTGEGFSWSQDLIYRVSEFFIKFSETNKKKEPRFIHNMIKFSSSKINQKISSFFNYFCRFPVPTAPLSLDSLIQENHFQYLTVFLSVKQAKTPTFHVYLCGFLLTPKKKHLILSRPLWDLIFLPWRWLLLLGKWAEIVIFLIKSSHLKGTKMRS